MNLQELKDSGYEATIAPQDSSAGVLDEDEIRNLWIHNSG